MTHLPYAGESNASQAGGPARVSPPTCTVTHGDALQLAPAFPRGTVRLAYVDPPFFSGRVRRNQPQGPAYDDRWPGGLTQYLEFLRALLNSLAPLLAPHGVLALHLDHRATHWARLELDRLFGEKGFINEIIWAYRTGGGSRRHLGRKHDNILVYAAGPDYVFHVLREKSYLAHHYGFSNITIEHDERGPYTWVAMRDVWDIAALRGNQREACGYPTQKPLALLSRLIECFTNPGDLVLDPCCGSGTALVAARALSRSAVGWDTSADAVAVAQKRLRGMGTAELAF